MYSPRIDRAFFRMVFTLVLPIAVQQLINACITSADIMMLGRVSESAIAGVSLAGQVSFLLNLILIGISSGASILCSQYWGKKDLRSIEELMGFSLCAGLFFFRNLYGYCILRSLVSHGPFHFRSGNCRSGSTISADRMLFLSLKLWYFYLFKYHEKHGACENIFYYLPVFAPD
ncbi:hypothetical protein DWX41_08615 [Hungatella hathewayi]|uniref:MATE efflux family protein n=1 Tax=Hungatella hathewayi TaxID=154046 RepID=A0A3E2WX47_9FIRM|nr:hypothetical protein DWX41_08615 [Hungatella hathewayi]